MNLIAIIDAETIAKRERPKTDVRSGDSVRVHVKIQEGDKSRIQIFEGTVVAIHKSGASSSFTVRKIASGVGVERIFPASSPYIPKIEVLARHKVRRGKLNFLRNLRGKAARLKPIRDWQKK